MENFEIAYIHEVIGAVGCSVVIPKSSKGFGQVFEVPCSKVDSLKDYCSGLLKGILLAKELSVTSVVFQPADSNDEQLRGLNGFPITVFRCSSERREDYYEFHTFFDTKAHTLKTVPSENWS